MREGSKRVLKRIPGASGVVRRAEEHMKGMVVPGTLFEELGFNYIGPVDAARSDELLSAFRTLKYLRGPQFLHVITQKGKGFKPAEQDPHGALRLAKVKPKGSPPPSNGPKYANVFGQWLVDMAAEDPKLMGITWPWPKARIDLPSPSASRSATSTWASPSRTRRYSRWPRGWRRRGKARGGDLLDLSPARL